MRAALSKTKAGAVFYAAGGKVFLRPYRRGGWMATSCIHVRGRLVPIRSWQPTALRALRTIRARIAES